MAREMICILHGYLLEGSGSNLWTRSIVEALCRQGHTVHLMAQENHPEVYPFIAEAWIYRHDGTREKFFEQNVALDGQCVLHKPQLDDVLPVYVTDRYEEFSHVVPMVELDDEEIERYISRNVEVLSQMVRRYELDVVHANHAVLMPEVARRIREKTGVPYVVMPHGSAIEYAVKRQERMKRFAEDAARNADRLFVIGDEMRERVNAVLTGVPGLDSKMETLHLGVDTSRFKPISREERAEMIGSLDEALGDVERGKTPQQSDVLAATVESGCSIEKLREVMAETSRYELKRPDEDLEKKLHGIDWARDRTLLYVGRLIANKGPQNIVAALPFVLEKDPSLRLVLVGHGPLREPLEALVSALHQGNVSLVREIIDVGRSLEGETGEGGPAEFEEWRMYLEQLTETGELDRYFRLAAEHLDRDRIVFTGYLTHKELRFLFPCFDAAVFPSLVREAGPLVFLEAMGSGIFPVGTYFGGMKASIDSLNGVIPDEDLEMMKISAEPDRLVADLALKLPAALQMGDRWRDELRRAAVENYDWTSVAGTLYATMREIAQRHSDHASRD